MPSSQHPAMRADRHGWLAWLRRVVLFAALWWILSGGVRDSWLLGAPLAVLAAWLSLGLWRPTAISWTGLLRFIPYFAKQSLAGATDVALRALRPSMPLHPGLVRHRLRLPPGAPRVAIANVITMLPGTLSADLDGSEVVIHALDTRHDLHEMVLDLEPRIAAVFGASLAGGEEQEARQ
jgi:multicomponent Na+:H+ antiporter subunit E